MARELAVEVCLVLREVTAAVVEHQEEVAVVLLRYGQGTLVQRSRDLRKPRTSSSERAQQFLCLPAPCTSPAAARPPWQVPLRRCHRTWTQILGYPPCSLGFPPKLCAKRCTSHPPGYAQALLGRKPPALTSNARLSQSQSASRLARVSCGRESQQARQHLMSLR